MEIQRKRQKVLQEKADIISGLPDELIHHILSFLASPKEAVQTGILSKRWLNQWTHVPALSFDGDSIGMSSQDFLKFVDNILIRHHSSKIHKFHLHYPSNSNHQDPHFHDKILFATRKHVQDLYLRSPVQDLLPQFLFNTASSLIKLTAFRCTFIPNQTVNWGSLTALHMRSCKLTHQSLQHILSGTPLLQSLELNNYYKFDNLVIVSKSLKTLVLKRDTALVLQISCPNLVKLSIKKVFVDDAHLFAQAIHNVLSTSLSLESFELNRIACGELDRLVIASNSLNTLVLGLNDNNILNIQVSCPHLLELKFIGSLSVETLELLKLPSSSLSATFDFYHSEDRHDDETSTNETCKGLVQDILRQLHHVKDLTLGSLFTKALSTSEVGGLSPFVLNIKTLTLNSPNVVHHGSGIARLLANAPMLEKLVINMPQHYGSLKKFNDSGDNFWNSDATIFTCLLPHLKTIQIIGFPMRYDERKLVVNFIQFLLNKAAVLEKMFIVLKGQREILPLRVSYPLLHLPRCSKYAIIHLSYSK